MSQKAAIRSEAERFFAAFQAAGAVAFEADHCCLLIRCLISMAKISARGPMSRMTPIAAK